MTRTTLHRAIEFRGLIAGCADYQWLITDALRDVASPSSQAASRWHISSHPQSEDAGSHDVMYEFYDRHLGLELSAPSAPALAEEIRSHFQNDSKNQ